MKTFTEYWNGNWPKTVPIAMHIRDDYHERWFRIHSLPQSKRYAYADEEWAILLNRQNTLITELLGEQAEFYLVTGRYFSTNPEITCLEQEYHQLACFRDCHFTEMTSIDLGEWYPHHYDADDGTHFVPAVARLRWKRNQYDTILKSIADDETRAAFVGIASPRIIAPYDGGVDCFVENEELAVDYKRKFKDWLSSLKSGL